MISKPSFIQIAGMKINSIGIGSSMNIGNSVLLSRAHSCKRNNGFGEQNADLTNIFLPIQIVIDSDEADAFAVKQSCLLNRNNIPSYHRFGEADI